MLGDVLKFLLPLVVALVLPLTSCTSLQSTFPPSPSGEAAPTYTEGHDPIVVDAEKTLRIGKDTFDTFLRLEYQNRATADRISPEIHKFAQTIRKKGPDWLITANRLKNTYKHNRTSTNKANLDTALATIQEAVSQAKVYINQLQ